MQQNGECIIQLSTENTILYDSKWAIFSQPKQISARHILRAPKRRARHLGVLTHQPRFLTLHLVSLYFTFDWPLFWFGENISLLVVHEAFSCFIQIHSHVWLIMWGLFLKRWNWMNWVWFLLLRAFCWMVEPVRGIT